MRLLPWFGLLAACTGASREPVTLHLAALNDFHGALYELPDRDDATRARGGLPWLHAALDALRADHPDLLVFDGGDLFQGSWPVNATRGMGAVEAYNLLGIDAAAVGNHEFDYGAGAQPGGHPLRGAFAEAAKRARFPWLAANIDESDGSPLAIDGIAPSILIERNGVKIGVFGLTTTDTPQTTLLKNVADLRFRDMVDVAKELAPKLREQGADVVVLVTHITGHCEPPGFMEVDTTCDMPGEELGALLTQLPPGTVDVIISGHAHTLLAQRFDDTFVLQQRSKGAAIGRLDLVVGPQGVDADASVLHPPWELLHPRVDPGCDGGAFPTAPIDVGGRTLAPSTQALYLIGRLEAEAGSLCQELGCAAALLSRSREAESAVGDLVTDAMLASFPGADLAVTNSGGLRADIPAGTIRREHVQGVMPFDNRVWLMEMDGAQVERLFRLGSSGAHGILQVAGGAYRFDPADTTGTDLDGDGQVANWETDRLCDVTVAGAPLDPSRTYKVVVNDFMASGGDHLGPAFVDVRRLEEGPLLRETLGTWVEQRDACLGAAATLDPPTPRIRVGPCGG